MVERYVSKTQIDSTKPRPDHVNVLDQMFKDAWNNQCVRSLPGSSSKLPPGVYPHLPGDLIWPRAFGGYMKNR